MLQIEISIPRPIETLSLLALAGGVALWVGWSQSSASAPVQATVIPVEQSAQAQGAGGPARRSLSSDEASVKADGAGGADRAGRVLAIKGAEDDARRIRMEQTVLSHREEILRYELKLLESQPAQGDFSAVQQAREELLRLLSDERAAEQSFLTTLHEMWEAEGLSASVAIGTPGVVQALWPVEPDQGLSATFLDPAYEQRFGVPHHAIDIPVLQGSAVRSAADGVVEKVMYNGQGYSYIMIKHDGFATLYGHVSAFFVAEGDTVRQGDVIARSGGMPGTPGAGALTTGPHLHFEVIVNGERVDPLTVLPGRPGLSQITQ